MSLEEAFILTNEIQVSLARHGDRLSDRKRRLFACACCRDVRMWPLLVEEESRRAIEVSEQFADGLCNCDELEDARSAARMVAEGAKALIEKAGVWIGRVRAKATAGVAASKVAEIPLRLEEVADLVVKAMDDGMSGKLQPRFLLIEVAGNLWHSIDVSDEWLTTEVVELAQASYDSRCFDRMSELADALKGAGCTNEDILAHCRGPYFHVRGCWVVDLILGKE